MVMGRSRSASLSLPPSCCTRGHIRGHPCTMTGWDRQTHTQQLLRRSPTFVHPKIPLRASRSTVVCLRLWFGFFLPHQVQIATSNMTRGDLTETASLSTERSRDEMAAVQPDRDEISVTADSLPLGHLASRVVCPTAGAIATFIGTTRDNFEGKRVVRLEVRAQ